MDATTGVTHRPYNEDIARRIQVSVTIPFFHLHRNSHSLKRL